MGWGMKWRKILKKRKQLLKKNNISRDVETTSRYMETFVTMMEQTVSQKNTLKRAGLKFVKVIGPKIGPTGTFKCFEK